MVHPEIVTFFRNNTRWSSTYQFPSLFCSFHQLHIHTHIHMREQFNTHTHTHTHTPLPMQLNYLSEGEIEETRIALFWFTFVHAFNKRRHPSIFTGITSEVDLVVGMGLKEDLITNFVTNHLLPWNSDVTYANRMFFMQQDGIQYVQSFVVDFFLIFTCIYGIYSSTYTLLFNPDLSVA